MRTLRRQILADYHDIVTRWVRPFEVFPGTEGKDTYKGTGGDDTINGLGGDDRLSGGDGGDLIDGGEGDDVLAGDGGDDILKGGDGDDTITSTAGVDTIDGGEGEDVWIGVYASATQSLTYDQRTGALSDGTTLVGIESIRLTTGSGSDGFMLTGGQAFVIDAGSGADTLTFDASLGSRPAEALTVTVELVKAGMNATIAGGTVTSRASGIETMAITGGSADDLFVVGIGKYWDGIALSLDGGGGRDTLTWDLRYYQGTTFIVRGDGTIETNIGAVSGFEIFDLKFGAGTNIVTLGDYNDYVTSAGVSDLVRGGAGDDTITSIGSSATLYGGAGNDTITVSGDNTTVFGNNGDDILRTTGRQNIVDGGLGYDSWLGALASKLGYDQRTDRFSNGTQLFNIESVTVSTSSNRAGSAFYIVRADDFNITSRNSGDRFTIDLSNAESNLGRGVDIVSYIDQSKHGYLTFGDVDITMLSHRKNNYPYIILTATDYDDTVTLSDINSNYFLPTLDGGGGHDTLSLFLFADSTFVVGEGGAITSSYGQYANFEAFNVSVRYGDNVIALGDGDDTIVVTALATGANDLSGGGGADRITGAMGDERLEGNDGDDVLEGGSGNDVLNGGLGDDTFDGGAGTDIAGYEGATAGVTVTIMAGAQDTGGAGVDTLVSIENVYGSEFGDNLTGDDGANILRGREGEDVLNGGGGADRLEGGPGADTMTESGGADTFAFLKLTDINLGAPDRILDFSHADGDQIELANIDLSKDPGDQQFTFIGASAFTGADDIFELRAEDAGDGRYQVQGDLNHDGVADFTFVVTAGSPLVATDFVL